MAKQHTAYLEKLAAYFRDELGCPDAKALSASEYVRIVGYGKGSLGGVICENSVPIAHCDTIADASSESLPLQPPADSYFEPSTSWAIALYKKPGASPHKGETSVRSTGGFGIMATSETTSIRNKVDAKRYETILRSQMERIRYLGHAKKYVDQMSPMGSSKELDALADASITLELAFNHLVWNE